LNQAALLQASVGKHRVTLEDTVDGNDLGNSTLQSSNAPGVVTLESSAPNTTGIKTVVAEESTVSSPIRTASEGDEVSPGTVVDPATGTPLAPAPQTAPGEEAGTGPVASAAKAKAQISEQSVQFPSQAREDASADRLQGKEHVGNDGPVGSEGLVLAEERVATSEREQAHSHSILYLASSMMTFVRDIATIIRDELPDSVVYMFPAMKSDFGAVFGLSLATATIWCSFVFAVAFVYRSNKAFPRAISSRPEQDFNDWTSTPTDVCADSQVCCWSCWCPCIRWADNMDMLGIVSFWAGLLMFCSLILLISVPGGLLLWLVASLLWMSFRQQLRLKFDMEQNTFKTLFSDCMIYCCCWPFAIAQEARHIEEASRAAHKAVRKFEAA
jgi:Cys-rich protein (TIGR01571 family)